MVTTVSHPSTEDLLRISQARLRSQEQDNERLMKAIVGRDAVITRKDTEIDRLKVEISRLSAGFTK